MSDEPLQLLHNCIMCRRRPLRLYVDTYLNTHTLARARAHTHALDTEGNSKQMCLGVYGGLI